MKLEPLLFLLYVLGPIFSLIRHKVSFLAFLLGCLISENMLALHLRLSYFNRLAAISAIIILSIREQAERHSNLKSCVPPNSKKRLFTISRNNDDGNTLVCAVFTGTQSTDIDFRISVPFKHPPPLAGQTRD